jgi:hypothetical protein
VEWAAESIRHSFWARVYYHQQREKGQAHQAAVRALAFKWLRMLFRCWQDRTPYNESVYLNALNRRGSALLQNLTQGERCGPDALLIRDETVQSQSFFANQAP